MSTTYPTIDGAQVPWRELTFADIQALPEELHARLMREMPRPLGFRGTCAGCGVSGDECLCVEPC